MASRKIKKDEIAEAIRYLAKQNINKSSQVDLRGFADNLMTWANYVFGTLVLGQVFFKQVDVVLFLLGVGIFVIVYSVSLFIYFKNKGGGKK